MDGIYMVAGMIIRDRSGAAEDSVEFVYKVFHQEAMATACIDSMREEYGEDFLGDIHFYPFEDEEDC